MRMLLAFLLLAGSAYDQNSLYVDISGAWKFADRDDPACSQPDFDDAKWQTLEFPVSPGLSQVPDSLFWLRRQVGLQPDAGLTNVVMTLGGMAEAYVVYVNGLVRFSTLR